MASTNLTSFEYLLKDMFTNDDFFDAVIAKSPFLAMLPKETDFVQKNDTYPVRHRPAGRRSKNFQVAQAGKRGSAGADFVLTRKKDYVLGSIDGETMDASAQNAAPFVAAAETEVQSAMDNLAVQMGNDAFGDGSGAVATIGSTYSSGTTIPITALSGLNTIYEGSVVVFAANATSALRASGTTATVATVNRNVDSPSFTIDAAPTGIAAGDLIFHEGDYETASDRNAISGLAAWFPSTLEGTAFYGVTRSTDRAVYAGHALNLTGLPTLEGLNKLCTQISAYAPDLDGIFVSPRRHEQIRNRMGAQVDYVERPAQGAGGEVTRIGFKGLKFAFGNGECGIYADPFCPDTSVFALALQSMAFKSLGEAPRFLARGGTGRFLTEAAADGVEFRIGYYGNIKAKAPFKCGHGYNFGA